jgi:tetratricopeptide (TPR) repeat protein
MRWVSSIILLGLGLNLLIGLTVVGAAPSAVPSEPSAPLSPSAPKSVTSEANDSHVPNTHVPTDGAFMPTGPSDLPDEGPRVELPLQGEGALLVEVAISAYRQGNVTAAETQFTRLIQQFPNSPLVSVSRAFLAEIRVIKDPTAESRFKAIDDYRGLLSKSNDKPNVLRAKWRIGDLYVDVDFHVEALAAYEQVLAQQPAGPDADRARLGIGRNYLTWGKYAEAERVFRHLLKVLQLDSPMMPSVAYGLAEALHQEERYKDSEAAYKAASQRWPSFLKDRAKLLLQVATNYERLGQEAESRKALLTLYNVHPREADAPDALIRIGNSFRRSGQLPRARFLYELTITNHPGSTAEGMAQMKLAELGQAMLAQNQERVVELGVRDSLQDRPLPIMESGQQGAVFQALSKAYAQTIVGSEALYHLGEHFEFTEEWSYALKTYQELSDREGVVRHDPWPKAARMRLRVLVGPWVEAALQAGDDLGAVRLFHRVGKLSDHAFVGSGLLIKIADAHRRLGFLSESIQHYQGVLKGQASQDMKEDALHGLGETYLGQRDWLAARQTFTKYRILHPNGRWRAEVQAGLVQVHAAQHQWDTGIKHARRFLQLFPQHPQALEVKRGLATILLAQGKPQGKREAIALLVEIERKGGIAHREARLAFADVLLNEQQVDEALSRYRAMVAEQGADTPEGGWSQMQLARIAQMKQRPQEAQALFETLEAGTTDELMRRVASTLRGGRRPVATEQKG